MRTRRAFIATFVLAVSSLALVHAADVTGRWTAKFETQVGEQEYTYEFVVKGTTLTGTAKGNLLGESPIAEGKVDGDKISFVENGTYMEMPLRIEYTGTIVSDGEIRFTRKIADLASEELVARRVK
jgi:hypothetical protein